MAILDRLPGVEVTIEVNNESANDYEDPFDEASGPNAAKTVMKHMESISDAQFKLKAQVHETFQNDKYLCFKVTMDSRRLPHGIGGHMHAEGQFPAKFMMHGEEMGTRGLHKRALRLSSSRLRHWSVAEK